MIDPQLFVPLLFGGGVRRPAAPSEILQWLRGGVLADGLTLIDRKDIVDDPELRSISLLSFDGVDDYVPTTFIPQDDSEVEFDIYVDATGTGKDYCFGNIANGTSRVIVGVDYDESPKKWRCAVGTFIGNSAVEATTGMHHAKINVDGLWIDDVQVITSGVTQVGSITLTEAYIGAMNNGGDAQHTKCKISNITMKHGATLNTQYPMQEGSGTVLFDVSSNNNDATIVGATWSTEDLDSSRNHSEGFSTYDDATILQDYRDNRGVALKQSGGCSKLANDNLLLTDENGAYISSDNGVTWGTAVDSIAGVGGSSPRMAFVASNGDMYYSPWGYGYLRRSTDGGTTWTDNLNFGHVGEAYGIWGFDEASDGTLFAGLYHLAGAETFQSQVYRSVDDGANWTVSLAADTDRHCHNVRVDPNTQYVYAVTGDTKKRTLRSTDNGDTWTDLRPEEVAENQCVAIEFFNGARLFGDDHQGKIWRTTDDVNFEIVYEGLDTTPPDRITYFTSWVHNGYVYMGAPSHDTFSRGRVVKSSDGITWEVELYGELTAGFAGPNYSTQRVSTNNQIYVVSGGGANNGSLLLDMDYTTSTKATGTLGSNSVGNSLFHTNSTFVRDWEINTTLDPTDVRNLMTIEPCDLYTGAQQININMAQGFGVGTNDDRIAVRASNRADDLSATVGQDVTMSIFIKGSSYGGRVQFELKEYDGGDVNIANQVKRIPVHESSEFERYSVTFTVGEATAASVAFSMRINLIDSYTQLALTYALPYMELGTSVSPFTTKESFGRVPSVDGVVDATDYPLSNPAGFTHNSSEADFLQVGLNIIDSISLDLTGGNPNTADYIGLYNDRGLYEVSGSGNQIRYLGTGNGWEAWSGSVTLGTNASNSTLPPKTGWVGTVAPSVDVVYESFWETSQELVTKTRAELDTHYDENGNLNLWLKYDANNNITEAVQYPLSKVFTPAEAQKNLNYFGTGGTPTYDGGGEVIVDVNGFIVYV